MAKLDPEKHIMIREQDGACLVYRKDKGWYGWTIDFKQFSRPYFSTIDAVTAWDRDT